MPVESLSWRSRERGTLLRLVDNCPDDAEFGALTIMKAECSLRRFIDDFESITVAVVDEREILRQIAPLAERLAANSPLLKQRPV